MMWSTNLVKISVSWVFLALLTLLTMACAAEATPTPGRAAALSPTPVPQAVMQQETPIGDRWWPSRWGPGDEAGASNWITPAKVKEAVKLIRTGEVFELGRVYEADIPLFGQRAFSLRIPGSPTGGPFGTNQAIYHDEFIATEIGQVGTQLDGLGHVGVQAGRPGDMAEMRFYNGVTEAEMFSPFGLKKLGIEKMKPLFTRGILIDVASHKNRMLDAGEEITLADVRGALRRQGMSEADVKPGDAVLFNTGWGSLWKVDNKRYNSGAPGIGMEVARWLVEKQVASVGADNWPVEVVPNPDPNLGFPAHNELITRHGIFLHENLDFTGLVREKVYEFAYIFVRVPIKGATGSPGSPIAVR